MGLRLRDCHGVVVLATADGIGSVRGCGCCYATLGQRLVDLVSFCLETSLNWCGVVRSNQIIVGGSAFPRQHVEVPTEHTKCQRTSTGNVHVKLNSS